MYRGLAGMKYAISFANTFHYQGSITEHVCAATTRKAAEKLPNGLTQSITQCALPPILTV
jgi:hypothetical protein